MLSGFGFKLLTPENWLTVDRAWASFILSSSRPDPAQAWVADLVEPQLNEHVPLNVRKLFEVARSVLVYGIMYYPLLAVGTDQLFRVVEAAVAAKCKALEAPAGVSNYTRMVEWLVADKHIPEERQTQWRAAIQLRNGASHLDDQFLYPPGDALSMVDLAVELIDSLFPPT